MALKVAPASLDVDPDACGLLPAHAEHMPLHGVRLVMERPTSGVQYTAPFEHELQVRYRTKRSNLPVGELVWQSQHSGERYQSHLRLYKMDGAWCLQIDCEGKGSFTFRGNGIEIDWRGGTGPSHYLQSIAIGLWLEMRSVTCIHANAVSLGDSAVGIIAPSQTGKSTLATALMADGFTLMSDDMLAVYDQGEQGWGVYPSWPQMRLWPDTVKQLLGQEAATLPRVHSRFAKCLVALDGDDEQHSQASKKLSRLYLLRPKASNANAVVIQQLGAAQATVALLQNSMISDMGSALGFEQERLTRLAKLVSEVPVYSLEYPLGLDKLPQVVAKLKQDMIL